MNFRSGQFNGWIVAFCFLLIGLYYSGRDRPARIEDTRTIVPLADLMPPAEIMTDVELERMTCRFLNLREHPNGLPISVWMRSGERCLTVIGR